MRTRHIGGVLGMTAIGLLHPGCGGTETHRAGLAAICQLNSDCAAPLVCSSGRCHAVCADDRDCDHAQCVSTPEGSVCELPSDAADASTSGTGGSSGSGGSAGRAGAANTGGAITSKGGAPDRDAAPDADTGDGGSSGSGGSGGSSAGGASAGGASAGGAGGAGGAVGAGGAGGNAAGGASPDAGSGTDAGSVDAGPPPPPSSCLAGGAGLTTCGAGGDEDCCASLLVTGAANYYRGYDGVTQDHTSQASPADVSDFRLDKFEITIGRYRQFKSAWDGGYRPAKGAGKHAHLNGGLGLASTPSGGNELGWDSSWAGLVDVSDATLGPCPGWAPSGTAETHPMNCITWYEALAFCIWDGGFLPSEAEWNYAASGGTEQRVYPWSNPATSTTIDSTFAVFCGGACSSSADVGSKPNGDGKYGQADLAGNVWEWTLDAPVDPYPTPCTDCAFLPGNPQYRTYRGGSYGQGATAIYASQRNWYTPETRNYSIGARCARKP